MASSKKTKFIVSDKKNPEVALKPGMKLHVTTVQLVGRDLRPLKKIGSRLCGGTSTCVALLDIGDDVINPADR